MSDTQSDDSLSSVYTQVTHEEHITLAPDTYVGSIEKQVSNLYVSDDENKIGQRNVHYTPGLYKIFDEVLVNAADHYTRLSEIPNNKFPVTEIKINISKETGKISIYNDGEGIDIIKLEEYDNIYAPSLIFGKLLTGSNYDQNKERIVGGKNGYGAKLANIFSLEFEVETSDSKRNLNFYQKYTDHMREIGEPIIKKYTKKPFTRITFRPDYEKFGMKNMEDDTFALFKKRAYDMSAWLDNKVKVYFNDVIISITSFLDYVKLYLPESQEIIHEKVNPRWEFILTYSNDDTFNQVSFVNGISTIRGGKHVDYLTDQIKDKLVVSIKKNKKVDIRPNTVKNQLFLFLKSTIVNPSFDSQTKETLTTTKKKFGSECLIDEKIIKKIMKTPIVEKIIKENEYKDQKVLKRNDGKKSRKIVGIPKLCDANKAGTKDSKKCTLILTEGDSAKTTAVSGLSIVGRDYYGVFPLKGKLLNVKDISEKKVQSNEEINNLVKIIGLKYKQDYDPDSQVWDLRYGKIMIMTDQDHDGSHIKGLVMNLFHEHWPSLFRSNFITCMVTPIIKCFKGSLELSFYTIQEYEDWKNKQPHLKGWNIKYYKGLGTSSVKEAKEYFKNLNIQNYIYEEGISNKSMSLAFDKNLSNDRKNWLSKYSSKNILDFSKKDITHNDFIDKELIQFSQADCKRSIPDIRDGLKPSQRKILYSCFKKNLTNKEIKVAQLSGYVSEQACYHHGEVSLQMSIINLAQDFVGSNNINLLYPSGQFGSRLKGGKDSASSRYIFTKLSNVTKLIFRDEDKDVLNYLEDDGTRIEPECYYPIIPMVLINGAKGIGTGHSTNIPNFSPKKVIKNIENRLKGKPFKDMKPFYRNFDGDIRMSKNTYCSYGRYEIISEDIIKIVELPIGIWTEDYKEFLDSKVKDKVNESKKDTFIKYYNDQSSECKVEFEIKFIDNIHNLFSNNDKIIEALKLKNSKPTSTTNMVLYNKDLQIIKYSNVIDIMEEFYQERLRMYGIRKDHLMKSLREEANILEDKYKYISAQVDKKLNIINKPEEELNKELLELSLRKVNDSFDYLTDMPQKALTKEKVIQLKEKYDKKIEEIKLLEVKTPTDIWLEELMELSEFIRKK